MIVIASRTQTPPSFAHLGLLDVPAMSSFEIETKQEKPMTTGDLHVSTRPRKWTKRGVQPPVEESQKAPLIALTKLAAQIREEADPIVKKRIEAEYASAGKGIEDLTSDRTSHNLSDAIIEIVTTFSPIIDPHPDAEESIRMPETMNRNQWQEMHCKLMNCKRAAAGWLAKSRKFAADRWGEDFVGKCESQMELALGMERAERIPPPPADCLKMALSIGKRAEAISGDEIADFDEFKRAAMLDALRPVSLLIQRLQAIEDTPYGNPTAES